MAKVKTLEFELNSVAYKTNINVGVNGVFSLKFPEEVQVLLRLNSAVLSGTSLSELEGKFKELIKTYHAATTTQELFLMIRYAASGKYMQKENGNYLFPASSTSPYNIQQDSWSSGSCLMLEVVVAIKETVDGKSRWFKAQQGKNAAHWSPEYQQKEKWFKSSELHMEKKYKALPYNETAHKTLLDAQEKMRKLSEMLFDFVQQDEQTMLTILTNQLLLK